MPLPFNLPRLFDHINHDPNPNACHVPAARRWPSFFMTGEREQMYQQTEDFLRSIRSTLPATPTAILLVTAHREASMSSVGGGPSPELIYDYYGFLPETYAL